MNRRNFLKSAGFSQGVLAVTGEQGSVSIEKSAAHALPGPYPLMWLSDEHCPYVEDVGAGLGCLKVGGNTQFSFALCPGVLVLDPQKDPIRRQWTPHWLSPVEPRLAPTPGLSLVRRQWRPHLLESVYSLDGMRISQCTVVYQYGATTRLELEGGTPFHLEGRSLGPCKLWLDDIGLHVVETSPAARPLAYTIRLHPRPDQVHILPSVDDKLLATLVVSDQPVGWRFAWRRLKASLVMDVDISRGGAATSSPRPDFGSHLSRQEKLWTTFYSEVTPRLRAPDDRINRLFDYLAFVYRANTLRLGGILPHAFTMPKQTFHGFWMWDCCFHAIAGCWYGDRGLVWGNLLNIENVQYPPGIKGAGCVTNSGNACGVNAFESDDPMAKRTLVMPHLLTKEQGDGSHPPVFAQALEAVWSVDGNERNLRRLLPNALAYHDWFERRRRSERFEGLLLTRRWSDTGMDNSKRWGKQGAAPNNPMVGVGMWTFPIVTVDLNVLSVLEKQSLANLLDAVGQKERAGQMRKEAHARAALIHELLWNSVHGFYLDRDETRGRFIPVLSPAGFYPLLLPGLDNSRQRALLAQLFDPKRFFAPAPLPSLAMDDPDFRPNNSYWMGPTWMSYNVYILRGLFRTDPSAGWKLLDRILDMLMPGGVPAIFENYNPLTGVGQNAANFGWHGMLVDVILREALGVTPTREGLTMGRTYCPDLWRDWQINNLYYRGEHFDVSSKRDGDEWKTRIRPRERAGLVGEGTRQRGNPASGGSS